MNASPAQPDVRHADIPAKRPDGETASLRRWVLQEHVWTKLLDQAGLTRIAVDVLLGGDGPRPADTLLVTARCPS
ncbi:hypothetical protein ITI46_32580 [Streptomyces oryzae]|uniref:Methyltransferase n=1 Tax=Streptomyces oryzae TaxID=1434886 RepID=A0ABS3XMW6_9ACTN|nr:hypothetical protein [Streptomyces oryzae]